MDPDEHPVTDDVSGIALEEHLTIVRVGGDLRARLLATLEGAGWLLVNNDDLPSPDPGLLVIEPAEDIDRQLSVSRQAAELVVGALAEVLDEVSTANGDLSHAEHLRAELDGLADLVAAELAEVRHLEDSTERLTRIAEGASGLGFEQCAPPLAAWVEQIAAGTAPRDPAAVALATRRAEIAVELSDGAGSVDRAPAVLEAHARRHELRSLSVELEGMVERGLTPESRQLIEDAHAERARAEDHGGRRGGLTAADALAAEERALARFGYASFLDFQISTSTRSVGEHAETTLVGVRADIERADRDLSTAVAAAAAAREALLVDQAEVESAISELAGNRTIDGILERPGVVAELQDQVRQAGEAALARAAASRERLAELQPLVDTRTQDAARAEAEVERLEDAHREAVVAWGIAEAAIAEAETELSELLVTLVEEAPLAVDADVAWLPADRLVAIFEAAASNGPVVWCTDRPDVAPSRALETPARWWQFRRRTRHGALTS